MKRIPMVLAIILVLAAVSGCTGTPVASKNSSPVPTAILMPVATASIVAASPVETLAGHEPEEDYEKEIPVQTPWPEPDMVDYSGQYLAIAKDLEPSRYPALKMGSTLFETTWGVLKLPEGWAMQDADGHQPLITDSKGRMVGTILQLYSYPTEPWFALKFESHTLITWEVPDYALATRVLTVESETPSAAEGTRKTIIRQVALITEGPVFDDSDTASYVAICLLIDKAYIDGEKVEYIASNQVIDSIARSFVDGFLE